MPRYTRTMAMRKCEAVMLRVREKRLRRVRAELQAIWSAQRK
jgi:hypothetical protein